MFAPDVAMVAQEIRLLGAKHVGEARTQRGPSDT